MHSICTWDCISSWNYQRDGLQVKGEKLQDLNFQYYVNANGEWMKYNKEELPKEMRILYK